MKSDNHTFIYFVGQYCCLTLDVNGFDKGWDFKNFMDLILPQWNICFKNRTYMHHVAFYIWLLKRYKVSWTCIYKILWGSIFQGCYGYGKVMGKNYFQGGAKVRENLWYCCSQESLCEFYLRCTQNPVNWKGWEMKTGLLMVCKKPEANVSVDCLLTLIS